jgi:hypothetical protein
MIDDRRPAGWLERAGVRYENLLRNSPRRLEVTCALLLGTLALMLFYDLALHRWLYFMYHQYYRSTSASRVYDRTVAGCEILVGVWLAGLAIDLARGASRRGDRGLFSPVALPASRLQPGTPGRSRPRSHVPSNERDQKRLVILSREGERTEFLPKGSTPWYQSECHGSHPARSGHRFAGPTS